ncbi:PKD domain-containing protein [Reinekea sp. G2M2-21]|uniref:PKD domain-containing protein n=1 Tax=Reinekea sp. G2M2-21 TaxID=2788942 RepID=UPI0018ABD5C9|nr:PKD domain-containing protein [Reinekea sp. G2M2-21]
MNNWRLFCCFICIGFSQAADELILTEHREAFITYENPYGFFEANVMKQETGDFIDFTWVTHMDTDRPFINKWATKGQNCVLLHEHPITERDKITGDSSVCSDHDEDNPFYSEDIGADDKWGQGWYNACKVHDQCYATVGKRREDCDREFKTDLINACKQSSNIVTCTFDANAYYLAVAFAGKKSFDETQTAVIAYLKNLKKGYEAGTCQYNAETSNALYLETEEARRDVYSWLGFYLHDKNFSKHKLNVLYESPWGAWAGSWWHDYDGFSYQPNKSLLHINEAKFNELKFTSNGLFDYVNWYKSQDIWEVNLDQSSYSVYLGDSVTFNGSSSHGPNGLSDYSSFAWNFGDGQATVSQPTAGSLSHRYSARGHYQLSLTATDPSNRFSRTTSASVTVYNFIDVLPAILHGL